MSITVPQPAVNKPQTFVLRDLKKIFVELMRCFGFWKYTWFCKLKQNGLAPFNQELQSSHMQ